MYQPRPGGERAKAKHNYGSSGGESIILCKIGYQPEDGKTAKERSQRSQDDKGCRRGYPKKPGRYGNQIGGHKLNRKKGFWLGLARTVISAGVRIITAWPSINQSLDICGIDQLVRNPS